MKELDPNTKLYMQFALTLLVAGFMGAAWWFGKVPAETALPIMTALVGIWLPGPLSGVAPGSRVLVAQASDDDDDAERASQAMTIPGSKPRTEPVSKEIKDVRDL